MRRLHPPRPTLLFRGGIANIQYGCVGLSLKAEGWQHMLLAHSAKAYGTHQETRMRQEK